MLGNLFKRMGTVRWFHTASLVLAAIYLDWTSAALPGGDALSSPRTSWSPWSACSASCGPGLSTRERQCPEREAMGVEGSKKSCNVPTTQIRICEIRACPPDAPSARMSGCAEYDGKVFSGRQYTWEPFVHPTAPCKLSCKAKGANFYANLADRVEDGVPCQEEGSSDRAVCIEGICKTVGCDGIVGSPAALDRCGRCQGDSSSCRTVSGIFTSTQLKRGLNHVINIPQGSTAINITELSPSRNLLLLQTISGKTFINNGGRPTSGDVKAAGTVFSYGAKTPERPRQRITAPGPTNVTIELKLLSRGFNPGVMYSFSVPKGSGDAFIEKITHHSVPPEPQAGPTRDKDITQADSAETKPRLTDHTPGDQGDQADKVVADVEQTTKSTETFSTRKIRIKENPKYLPSEMEQGRESLGSRNTGFVYKKSDIIQQQTYQTPLIDLGIAPQVNQPNIGGLSREGMSEEERKSREDKMIQEVLRDHRDSVPSQEDEGDYTMEDLISSGTKQSATIRLDSVMSPSDVDEWQGDSKSREEDQGGSAGEIQSKNQSVIESVEVLSGEQREVQHKPIVPDSAGLDSTQSGDIDEGEGTLLPESPKGRKGSRELSPSGANTPVSFLSRNKNYHLPKYSQSFTFAERYKNIYSRKARRRPSYDRRQQHRGRDRGSGISAYDRRSPVIESPPPRYIVNREHKTQSVNGRTLRIKQQPVSRSDGGRGNITSALESGGSYESVSTPQHEKNDGGVHSSRGQLRDRQTLFNNRQKRLREQRRQYQQRLREYQEELARRRAATSRRRGGISRSRSRFSNPSVPSRTTVQAGGTHGSSRNIQPAIIQRTRTPGADTSKENPQTNYGRRVGGGSVGEFSFTPKKISRVAPPREVKDTTKTFPNSENSVTPLTIHEPVEKGSRTAQSSQRGFNPPQEGASVSDDEDSIESPPHVTSRDTPGVPAIIPSRVDSPPRQTDPNTPYRPQPTTPLRTNELEGVDNAPRANSVLRNRYPPPNSGDVIPRTSPRLLANQIPLNTLTSHDVARNAAYEWRISGLTECTHSCGGGLQQTLVVCVDMVSQATVTEDNCQRLDKPKKLAVKCNTRPCPAVWTASSWSSCSVTCGQGQQTRKLACLTRVSPTLNLTMPASSCDGLEKPTDIQSCNKNPCSSWKVGEWSQCSAGCGDGAQTREVTCIDLEGQAVDEQSCTDLKPDEQTECNLGTCGKGWFFTDWPEQCPAECGTGRKSRKIFCSGDDGEILPHGRCDESHKPSLELTCRVDRPCGGHWFLGEWTKCNATCGQGYKTRDILCIKGLKGGIFAVVGEENCEGVVKPEEAEPCDLPDCHSEWYMTSWTECSQSCGTGYRTREVKCLDPQQTPSGGCPLKAKPRTRDPCNTQACESATPVEDVDPDCFDKFSQCDVVKRTRLCRYKYYQRACCKSCKSERKK